MSDSFSRRKTLWVIAYIGNSDGTLDLTGEIPNYYDTEEEGMLALEACLPLEAVLYKMAPYAIAEHSKTRIKMVKP